MVKKTKQTRIYRNSPTTTIMRGGTMMKKKMPKKMGTVGIKKLQHGYPMMTSKGISIVTNTKHASGPILKYKKKTTTKKEPYAVWH